MEKQILTFFTIEDEKEFSTILLDSFKGVRFINNGERLRQDITFHHCLSKCNDWFAWILNEDFITESRKQFAYNDKRFWQGLFGMQFLKSRLLENMPDSGFKALRNGRVAVFIDDPNIMKSEATFAKRVFKIIEKISVKVDCISPDNMKIITKNAPMFRAGNFAKTWVGSDAKHLLKSDNTLNYFIPTRNDVEGEQRH
jgi:hypothetical protein